MEIGCSDDQPEPVQDSNAASVDFVKAVGDK